jgi:UDP-glucose 4-epimerase
MITRICLITGGAGFIGSHIAEALVRRGDRVRVLDNLSTGRRANLAAVADRIEFIQGDVCQPSDVEKAVRGANCVFHQAAIASVPRSVEQPLETHAACVTGTLNVLDQARRAGVKRVVYAASSSAYGDLPFSSKRESDLPEPLSPYAAAKLAGELYCQAFFHTYGLETVGLRYFNVFGPRQDPTGPYSAVIPVFISKILSRQRPVIFGDGHQSRDFAYVENVVSANLLAAEKEGIGGRTFNVGSGRSVSLLDLLSALNRILGTDVQPLFEPARKGDVRDSLADITQAASCLGYVPEVGLEEGLRRTVSYYQGGAPGR